MANTKTLSSDAYVDCWYVPRQTAIVDMIHSTTGLTAVLGRDAASVHAEHPTAQRLPWADASRQIDDAGNAKFRRDITEIDEAAYWYALEVLPPVGWTKRRGVESFRMSERTCANLTNIYAQLGDRYFQLTDDIRLPADTIAERVAAYAVANPPAPKTAL